MRVQQQQQQDDGWEFLAIRPSTAAPLYTRLTQNIAGVVRRLDPGPEELQRRHHVLQAVSLAVASTFPEYRGIARVSVLCWWCGCSVLVCDAGVTSVASFMLKVFGDSQPLSLLPQVKAFGSFVSGLGTKDSDIDLVITGAVAGVGAGAMTLSGQWVFCRVPSMYRTLITVNDAP